MASKSTRFNIKNLDRNSVLDHGGSKQVDLHGTRANQEAEVICDCSNDAALAQRQLESNQLEEKDKHSLLEGNVAGRKKTMSKKAKLGNILNYKVWLTMRCLLRGSNLDEDQDVEKGSHEIIASDVNVSLKIIAGNSVSTHPRSPATASDCKTPIEVWSGKPANYLKLCVFGCPAYYHVSEGKLDLRGEKGIFIGYGDGVKGYRIWSPSERRVILNRDVTFEKDYLFHVKQDPVESKLKDSVSEKAEDVLKQVEHVVLGDMDHDDTLPDDHTNSPHLEHEKDRSIAHDRPRRNAKAPSQFGFEDYVAYALQVAEEVVSLEPATYQKAITSKESDMWITAMGEEIEYLHKNKTWELV
ncbi:retrovirus-related pol polyprotein from transposon TNT 1-94 [Tanacetum coccineum]